MKIKETQSGDVTVLALSGKMMEGPETSRLHDYVKGLIEKKQVKIVVDLGKVKWFASTGLGALLASYTSLRNAGGDLKVARATRKIYSVFMYTELIKIIKNYPSIQEATDSFSNPEGD